MNISARNSDFVTMAREASMICGGGVAKEVPCRRWWWKRIKKKRKKLVLLSKFN